MTGQPRSVFFGTPDFALPVLDALLEETEIALVVTRADKPAGRGQKVQSSPIKVRASALGLAVATPSRLGDERFVGKLRGLNADVAVVSAYGRILPRDVLEGTKHGFLNVHPSLLPRHRGPSPVAAAILEGDRETGVTLILLDDEMDHGPVVAQERVPIEPRDHRPQLEARLAKLGANLLKKTLSTYLGGTLRPIPQDHREATFTNILHRHDARIDWRLSAERIERQVRAYDPWPGTETTFCGSLLKILDAEASSFREPEGEPGTVTVINGEPGVVCGKDALRLKVVQVPGKTPTAAAAFARGRREFIGSILGT